MELKRRTLNQKISQSILRNKRKVNHLHQRKDLNPLLFHKKNLQKVQRLLSKILKQALKSQQPRKNLNLQNNKKKRLKTTILLKKARQKLQQKHSHHQKQLLRQNKNHQLSNLDRPRKAQVNNFNDKRQLKKVQQRVRKLLRMMLSQVPLLPSKEAISLKTTKNLVQNSQRN